MTTPEAPAAHSSKGAAAFLTKKVGPLPVWVWMVAAVGVYLWYSHQQAAASNASAVPNEQTDPAGNVGSIDPATGYVYGTPEDIAALAANNSGSTGTGSAGQNATTGAQTYADNNAWGIAAVNYLVGLGIDATTANEAIQQYLSSQPLTSAQQGDVNLAVQALGSPPSLPGPTGTAPNPVTTPGSGGSGGSTSTGPTVTVPNVVGQPIDKAGPAITAAGLKYSGPSPQPGKTVYVTTETPPAGTQVPTGSQVNCLGSTTAPAGTGGGTTSAVKVRVPNVVGDDVVNASSAMQSAGLKLTPEVPAVKGKTHTVTSQTPSAGSMVPKGATVTIKYKTVG